MASLIKQGILLALLAGVLYFKGYGDGYNKKEAEYSSSKASSQQAAQEFKIEKKRQIIDLPDPDFDARFARGLRDSPR